MWLWEPQHDEQQHGHLAQLAQQVQLHMNALHSLPCSKKAKHVGATRCCAGHNYGLMWPPQPQMPSLSAQRMQPAACSLHVPACACHKATHAHNIPHDISRPQQWSAGHRATHLLAAQLTHSIHACGQTCTGMSDTSSTELASCAGRPTECEAQPYNQEHNYYKSTLAHPAACYTLAIGHRYQV